VVLTDGNDRAAAWNSSALQANNLAGTAYRLSWGHKGHIATVLDAHPKFNLVLAADVLYGAWRSSLPDLLDTSSQLLAPHGRVVLSVCGKRMGAAEEDVVPGIQQICEQAGFCLAEVCRDELLTLNGCSEWEAMLEQFDERWGHILVLQRRPLSS